MAPIRVNIRGQLVPLHRAGHARGFSAYQGGDYFEFHQDGAAGRWLMSQSAEDRLHDPGHVVACGASVQDAANSFNCIRPQHIPGPPYVATSTRGCDLAAASIDTLVIVLAEALRLGYHDEGHGHPQLTGNEIADSLGLARWNGLQQLQLRHAYKAGREHLAIERIQRAR